MPDERSNVANTRTWVHSIIMAMSVISAIIGVAFWLAHVEDRISTLEGSQQAQDRQFDRMDNNGTRKLGIVEDRQNSILRRLEIIEQRINQRWGQP